MKRLQKAARPGYTEDTLQAWEEMRVELLHEIQDGGSAQEEQIEAASDVGAHLYPWKLSVRAPTRPGRAARK
ncbi:MAG: hypothetical protein ACM30E_03415 [Nitrososphaerales archaeon]